MLNRNRIVRKETNLGFNLICMPRVFCQYQQRTLAAGCEILRKLSGRQGAAGADQAAPGCIVAGLRKLEVGGKK